MANFQSCEELIDAYTDDTIAYSDILQHNLSTASGLVTVTDTSCQSLFSGLSSILSSVSQAEATTQLASLTPASSKSPLMSEDVNIFGKFSVSDPVEMGSSSFGVLQSINSQGQGHDPVLRGQNISMDIDGVNSTKTATGETVSTSDAMILEELNAIFGYNESNSPEVTSSNSETSADALFSTSISNQAAGLSTNLKTKKSPGAQKLPKRLTDDHHYRKIRDKNNLAVKKSRAKAKQRQINAEKQVELLQEENKQLRKQVESLSRELDTLKGVITNVVATRPDVVGFVKGMDSATKTSDS